MREPLRVLLVEDSVDDAELLAAELRRAGFDPELERVETEPEFLAALARGQGQILLMDYSLPRFGAPRALEVLRQRGIDLPAIVVTGTVGDEELVEAMRGGARDYVQKDNLARLAAVVRRELAEATARRERAASERSLREIEERFRWMVEHSGEVLYRLRFSDMSYDYMSPGIRKLTGYSPEEIFALGFANLTVRIDGPGASESEREQRRLDMEHGRGREFWGEYQVRTRSGELRWIADHSRPWSDDAGRVVGSVGILVDITERKGIEERLRQSEEHFRSLIEDASDLILVLDAEGRALYESPAMERMLGYAPQARIGQSVLDLLPPEDEPRVRAGLLRLADEPGVTTSLRTRARHQDGSWRNLEVLAKGRRDEGGHATVIVNARDVTERVNLEAQFLQMQKIEAVGRLAGGVAHDFNNLVTAILGYSNLLRRALRADDPLRRHVEEIAGAAQRAAALTQQLLAFSRKQVLRPRVLDLGQFIDDSRDLFQRLIGEDIELITRPVRPLGAVRADPVQIEQVLLNLVINARDAMPQGGRLILEVADAVLDEVYTRDHVPVQPGRYVLLAVSDTGHGMDRETQSRVFEPFFTTKEVGKGTGLGLATVYGIVKQSGGYVWLYSEPGQGTTFKVYLPRVQGTVETVAEPALPAVSPGWETVLLVEDELPVRNLVRELLEAAGYKVLEASRSEDALGLAREHAGAIHLIVTDVIMPRLSGPDLVVRVRQLRPDCRVLFLSGYSPGMVAERGVPDDRAMFLQKPFTAEALEAKVREALDAPVVSPGH